MKTTEVV
jgi:hypothetical protein